jgi:MerR family transcriptional regulator, heat shock protein HspR
VLHEVVRLSALGLGLEGVRQVLDLENQVAALRSRVRELEAEVNSFRRREQRSALVVWRPDRRR